MSEERIRHQDTDAIHVGEEEHEVTASLVRPIYTTSTFVFDSAVQIEAYQAGRSSKHIYSRYGNPTVEATEAKLAVLEGCEAAMLTSSGMAATATALFGLLEAGDEMVCSTAVYGGTLQLLSAGLHRFGVSTRLVALEDLTDASRLAGARTRVVWFESPTNPTLRCVDIAAVARACRQAGVLSIIDSTFASPVNQRPLQHGVDLVMHSATKYLNGHSDVIAGVLLGSRELIGRLQPTRRLFGGVLDPTSAYALGRGLKTLGVRVARQNDSALRIARWCEDHANVIQVCYPGLPSHPDHVVATRQMSGFGGMVTIDVAGGYATACRVFDRFQLVKRAASLGGVETLCSIPVLTSQYGLSDDQLAAAGVTRGMMRLSIGLEDPDDLIADLEQALADG